MRVSSGGGGRVVGVPAVEGLRLHLDPLVRRSQIWYHPLVRPSRLFITDIFQPNWDDLGDNLRYILQSKFNQDSIRKDQQDDLNWWFWKQVVRDGPYPHRVTARQMSGAIIFATPAWETSDFERFCCLSYLQTRIKTLLAMLGCQLTMIYTDCCWTALVTWELKATMALSLGTPKISTNRCCEKYYFGQLWNGLDPISLAT